MRLYVIMLVLLLAAATCFDFRGRPVLRARSLQFIATRERRLLITAVMLILISGLRNGIGTDYNNYVIHYNAIAIGADSGSNFELGYNLLNGIMTFIGFSDQWLFLVLAAILVICVTKVAYEYSEHAEMSMYLFVALYFYFSSFNILRQYLAIPIIFCAMKYLVDRKFVPYTLCVLLAATFHYSALIMLPFFFIARIQLKEKHRLCILALGFLFGLVGRPIISFIITLFPRYSIYFAFETGSAWCDLIMMGMCYALLYFTNETGKQKKVHTVYVNAVTMAILFSFLTFTNVLFARISPYFYLYTILSIPHGLKYSVFDKKARKLLSICICGLAFVICVYYLLSNNGGVVPYS